MKKLVKYLSFLLIILLIHANGIAQQAGALHKSVQMVTKHKTLPAFKYSPGPELPRLDTVYPTTLALNGSEIYRVSSIMNKRYFYIRSLIQQTRFLKNGSLHVD
jgi:hypothetical protein